MREAREGRKIVNYVAAALIILMVLCFVGFTMFFS